ncbi:MAG TPA: DUF29 domain-containing protein [Pseudohaliea sp.]|nr:DUF29 domain-containing protein [Pseudohaliea sp.]
MADHAPERPDRASLYDEDFYAWIRHQIGLLQQRRLDSLDLDNLIEELEAVGRAEKRSVFTNMRVILQHLLQLRARTSGPADEPETAIGAHRVYLAEDFRTSPSLRPYAIDILPECYDRARTRAAEETGLPLSAFPADCPESLDQVLDPGYLPGTKEGPDGDER